MKSNVLYRNWKAVNAMTLQGSFVKFSKIQDMVCFCPFLNWLIPLQGQKYSIRIGVNFGSKHSKRKKDHLKVWKLVLENIHCPNYQHHFWETSQKQDYSLMYWNKICQIFRSKGNSKVYRQFIFTENTYWSLKVYGWAVVAYIFWTLRNV